MSEEGRERGRRREEETGGRRGVGRHLVIGALVSVSVKPLGLAPQEHGAVERERHGKDRGDQRQRSRHAAWVVPDDQCVPRRAVAAALRFLHLCLRLAQHVLAPARMLMVE